jgi:endonuclease I
LSYKDVWKAFAKTDPLPNQRNKVFDIYSYDKDKTPYLHTFFVDQCRHYKKEGDCYNREHSFPKGWWGGSFKKPMATDLFHIYPTDGFVNNIRSNYPYAEVNPKNAKISKNGSMLGESITQGYKQRAFEPINEFKGDLARGYFYLITAYYDRVKNWSSPMLKDGNFSQWAKKMLLKWHKQDPVSDKEKERNEQIKAIQGNYNPFIENPELVEKIWSD